LTPELAWAFEAALVLAAGGFHGAAADGIAASFTLGVVHAVAVVVQVSDPMGSRPLNVDFVARKPPLPYLSQDKYINIQRPDSIGFA